MPTIPSDDVNGTAALELVTTKNIDAVDTTATFWSNNAEQLGMFLLFFLLLIILLGVGFWLKKMVWGK